MAIAYDSSASGTSAGTSTTFAHTCAGSNRILFVEAYSTSGDDVTGITYNGAAMTQVSKVSKSGSSEKLYLYYLLAPATGSNNVVVSRSGSGGFLHGASASYTGALQSGVPDSFATSAPVGNDTSISISTTSILDNCWLVGSFVCDNGGITAGSSTTVRAGDTSFDVIADSNGAKTPAGSYALAINCNNAGRAGIVASFAPSASTVNANFLMFM
jgi:hypothetical protein